MQANTLKIFIPVFFNAPLGGLQSHVESQCLALKKSGSIPVVMCKPGLFSDQLHRQGIDVLNSDFTDINQAIAEAIKAGPFDLVHAHPFASRKVGLEVSKKTGCPFIVTYHGCYDDQLSSWSSDVNIVIAVSAAIRDFLVNLNCIEPKKIFTIPNGVNLDIFCPKKIEDSVKNQLKKEQNHVDNSEIKRILLVSRLDQDKKFIIDTIKDTWQHCINNRVFSWDWLIAGDGTLRAEMELEANQLNQSSGKKNIGFLGWQSELELANLYNTADLVIGPGRCAIEAMACGTPVIAIGSKTYIGLVNQNNFADGIYSNFGGGIKQTILTENMFHQIESIIEDKKKLQSLGDSCKKLVKSYFDQQLLDNQLLSLYKMITCDPICQISDQYIEINSQFYSFCEPNSNYLSSAWSNNAKSDKLLLSFLDKNALIAQCLFDDDEHAYIATGNTDFNKPLPILDNYLIEKNATYKIALNMKLLEGSVLVGAWFIEYGTFSRINHAQKNLAPGENLLIHKTSPQAHSFKLALRFSKKGIVKISPFQIFMKLRA